MTYRKYSNLCLLAWFVAAFTVIFRLDSSESKAAQSAKRYVEEGWKPLFNGKDLSGWEQKGGKAVYRVENREIVGTAVPKTGNSFLCTQRSYTNFVLELEFKVINGLNSGVQVRSQCFDEPTTFTNSDKVVKIPAGRVHGYQIEIDPSARAWTGGIYEEGRRGWLNNLKDNEAARLAYRSNDWNHFRIEATGDHLRTRLNGVSAGDLKDSLNQSGFLGLQVHGIGTRTNLMEVRFREVWLREMP